MAVSTEFTYSGDPTTSVRDEVRFLCQDTDCNVPMLYDPEMDYLIGQWLPAYGSPIYVASIAAAVIGRKLAAIPDVSADGVSVQTSNLSTRYMQIAKDLRNEYQLLGDVGGLVNLDNILTDTSIDYTIKPLSFGMRLHDNAAAGMQDYGNRRDFTGPSWDADEGAWR